MPDPTTTPERVPTVDSKPAVGVYAGALTTLSLSLANRYTAYQPTLEETGAILIIVSGAMMWLIPSSILSKLNRKDANSG